MIPLMSREKAPLLQAIGIRKVALSFLPFPKIREA